MSASILKMLVTIVPVLSWGLYLMGATYHQGYLAEFGIDDSMLVLPTDRLLLSGFFSFLNFGLLPSLYAALAIILLILAVALAASVFAHPRARAHLVLRKRRFALWLRRRRSVFRTFLPAMEAVEVIGTVYVYVACSTLVLILLAMVAHLSSLTGREHARKEKTDFARATGSYVEVSESASAAVMKAKQLVCSSAYCAFWLGAEAVVLKTDQINRITAHRFREKGGAVPGGQPQP